MNYFGASRGALTPTLTLFAGEFAEVLTYCLLLADGLGVDPGRRAFMAASAQWKASPQWKASAQWKTERAVTVTSMGTMSGTSSVESGARQTERRVTVAVRPSSEAARTSSTSSRSVAAVAR